MPSASLQPVTLILDYLQKNSLKAGTRFPTARALSAKLGIGRMALNRAITELIGRGVLLRHGHKLFVGEDRSNLPIRAPLDLFIEKWHDDRLVLQLATRWGLDVRVHRSAEAEDRRRQLLDLKESGRPTSGVLIYGAECEAELARLQKAGVPVMVFGDRSALLSFTTYHPRSMVDQALRHLLDLGHRELAFIAPPPQQSYPLMHREVESTYVEMCKSLGLHSSAGRLLAFVDDPTSQYEVWRSLQKEHAAVTGLICENIFLASRMIDLAVKDGISIPRELSVIGVYSQDARSYEDISVTATQLDERQLLQVATLMLLDDIETGRTASGRPVQKTTLCQPRLFLRQSTGPAPQVAQAEKVSTSDTTISKGQQLEWSENVLDRKKRVRALNNKPFHSIKKRRETRYEPVDLGEHLNRRLTSYHGWLGQLPLLHLPPGETLVHGVPCHIEERALVLRSRFARSGRGQALPDAVTIPVNRNVDGVFILHAGGWLKYHESIGTYEFATASLRDLVEIVAYGSAAGSRQELKKRALTSILGDWHPSGAQFEGKNARQWLVTQDGDPLRYTRYLYLYHWINPNPGTRLQSLKVRVHQPTLQATLGILAVTTYRSKR